MFDESYCAGMALGRPEISIEGLNELASVLASFAANRKEGAHSSHSIKKETDRAEKPASQSSAAHSRAGTSNSRNTRGAKHREAGRGPGRSSAGGLWLAIRRWEAWMNPKITPDHLGRSAVVYVRQSTMAQVTGNLESQRRQYDLAQAAQAAGFVSVTVIDDDLGRSGSGTMQRPGFERLVAMVCSGDVGAVYRIEASRLARNGRDWHHLIDLCALAGTLVVD